MAFWKSWRRGGECGPGYSKTSSVSSMIALLFSGLADYQSNSKSLKPFFKNDRRYYAKIGMISLEKHVVFLVYWPVTMREKSQWGFDLLRDRGFNVQVCDVTELCNKSELKRNPVSSALDEDYITRFKSFAELELYLNKTPKNAIFIDYIRGLVDLDIKTEKVFRLLKKYNIKYFTIITGSLPIPSLELRPLDRAYWYLSRLLVATNPIKLADYLVRIAIRFLRAKKLKYPLPTRIFATNAPILYEFLRYYNLGEDVVVKMHSPDYYDYLREIATLNDQHNNPIEHPYCLFIDEGMVGHSDIDICGIRKLDKQDYSREINRILDYIEQNFKIKIIVAAHPRSKLEVIKTVYPNRDIVQGKTLKLIPDAQFVTAHLSSVVGYAALFKKPIIFIETEEMRKDGYYHATIHSMAKALGLTPFQTDVEKLDKINKYIDCSTANYDEYITRYVRTPGASNEEMWDIVCRELEKEQ